MTEREKVIKGLEIHLKPNSRCVGCPYPNNGLCGDQLYRDALSLLKAQEPQKAEWTTKRTQKHDGEWYCTACDYEPIVMTDDMEYCPGCGAKMDLEESE